MLSQLRGATRRAPLAWRTAVSASSGRAYHAPVREMNFLLNDVHGFPAHFETLKNGGEQCDKETMDMVIEASQQLCENELAPLLPVADAEGCKWVDEHTVKTPTGFKEAYDLYAESGWQGLSFPEQYGGQGLPQSLALIQSEMIAAANYTFLMFPGLSKGAINTILAHGSDELKEKYLARMISGEWTGTMCLTEPQCGSDLNQVATKAEPIGDGKYKIK